MKRHSISLFSTVTMLLIISLFHARAEENLSLAGTWRFSRDEDKVGISKKWYDGTLKTVGGGPMEVSLPGTTDEAKAGMFFVPESPRWLVKNALIEPALATLIRIGGSRYAETEVRDVQATLTKPRAKHWRKSRGKPFRFRKAKECRKSVSRSNGLLPSTLKGDLT